MTTRVTAVTASLTAVAAPTLTLVEGTGRSKPSVRTVSSTWRCSSRRSAMRRIGAGAVPGGIGSGRVGEGPFPFAIRQRVRFAETDLQGVVYYANYLVYAEVGRLAYL